jgi:pyruvate/2-oxoglutarate dehydrogenase complex dihydrolipoamide acyltransferase (E2) component
VEATISGTLAPVLAEEGRILKPGDPLAVIAEPASRETPQPSTARLSNLTAEAWQSSRYFR